MNISLELWRQIDPLLSNALELDVGARAAWLQSLDQTHPQLAPVLRKMLAVHDRAERSHELETVPRLVPSIPPSSGFAAGARIGPFALIRLLGRGGMGEVWLAKQADGRVEREVALKLPTIYLHSEVWRERFRRERDILARLTHPNIAHLFDAGVSEEEGSRGQPYLAMEYIEGVSLTEFAASQRLPLAGRLALFRQILAAVAHAHRHLVVHRDLKPANILIDQSGQVKLLDFGIAKLIDDGTEAARSADLTQMGGRVMTLRYAAPEQVSGGGISTATDIYALGVILHELLTGLSPYRAVREGRALTETSLLGEAPTTPSSLALSPAAAAERDAPSGKLLSRSLSGDLDAIVLKALRREAADRYASVEQFDEDIASHLARRPVKARKGTWRYLAGRFVVRHRLLIASSAAVLLTVGAGVVMVERERRVAVAQSERAARHFSSVRHLAHSLIFDVHDQMANVAGTTRAKQTLVENASTYLAQLTPEAGDDPAFRRELAEAYLRLGNIQGQYSGQNIGRPHDALQSFDQAIALLSPAADPAQAAYNAESAEVLVRVYLEKSQVLFALDRVADSAEAARAGLAIAERLAARPGASAPLRLLHARMVVEMTHRQAWLGDRKMRVRGLQQGIEIVNSVLRSLPAATAGAGNADDANREKAQDALAWMSSSMGYALRRDEDPAVKRRAVEKFREALAIREEALRKAPGNAETRRFIVAHNTAIAFTLILLGEDRDALPYAATSAAAMQALLAEDPGNVQYLQDVFATLSMLARTQRGVRQYAELLVTARRAHEIYAKIPDTIREISAVMSERAALLLVEGEAQLALAAVPGEADRRATRLAAANRALHETRSLFAALETKPEITRATAKEQATLQRLLAEVDRALLNPGA